MKRIAWIDTVRVFAAFMIIVTHYFMCDGFSGRLHLRCVGVDAMIIGVSLFMAISGYLIPNSLERSSSLWNFYKRNF